MFSYEVKWNTNMVLITQVAFGTSSCIRNFIVRWHN